LSPLRLLAHRSSSSRCRCQSEFREELSPARAPRMSQEACSLSMPIGIQGRVVAPVLGPTRR
jgi:hypothetical protein